jgi:hypothetical protein
MKMKLIVLLLVIFNIALGQFCPGEQKLKNFKSERTLLTAQDKFLTKYNKDAFEYVSLENKDFDIQGIRDGLIILKMTGTVVENALTYLAHNDVVCNPDANLVEKECLIQLLSIKIDTIYFYQVKFSYTRILNNSEVQDCEEFLRENLRGGLTCNIDNSDKKNPIFKIPLPKNERSEILFYTETNEFAMRKILKEKAETNEFETQDLTEGEIEANEFEDLTEEEIKHNIAHPTLDDDSITLTLGTRSVKFPRMSSCYYLLIKINHMLPRECSKDTIFYYFYMQVYFKNKLVEDYDKVIPREGNLKIKSVDEVEFSRGSLSQF